MKRAIVTGATGAVGIALLDELIAHGVEILVLCRKDSPRNERIPVHQLVTRKICDLNELGDLQKPDGKEYDVFYHLAWQGTTGNARNDMYLQSQNVRNALDAVGAAKRFGCQAFVGIGSQAEYGRCEGILTSETPVFPENGYGMGKLMAGLMTRELAHQLGMRHVWTRILSVYGPCDGLQSLVMSLILNLKNGEVPRMTQGEQRWDYLYSGDAAKALYLLGDKGVDGKTYVLGSGTSRPLREYAEIIRQLINPDLAIDYGAIPYSEKQVMNLCADISELTKDTGWKPTATFEEHMRQMLS